MNDINFIIFSCSLKAHPPEFQLQINLRDQYD